MPLYVEKLLVKFVDMWEEKNLQMKIACIMLVQAFCFYKFLFKRKIIRTPVDLKN